MNTPINSITLTTFDWVIDMPGVTRVTYVCTRRWKRLDCPIVSRAGHLALGMLDILPNSPSAKNRG